MEKILYQDEKYKLYHEEPGMVLYLLIDNNKYILTSHSYLPCTYIKNEDQSIDITLADAFDMQFVIKDFSKCDCTNAGNIYSVISKKEFCEIINTAISRDRLVQERKKNVNRKIHSCFDVNLIKYYRGYFIYGEIDRESWDRKVYWSKKYDINGNIVDEIEGDFYYCQTLDKMKNEIDKRIDKDGIQYIGNEVIFHGITCKILSMIDDEHYRLVPVVVNLSKLRNDKSFVEKHMWEAVAMPIICPVCGKITWFDDNNILEGLKYEVNCEYCDMIMFRKKV